MRILAACLAVAAALTVTAAKADLTRQEPITIRVDLGNAEDARVFEPAGVTFETGKLYKLVLHNPSKTKHYFTSPGLADRVFTRKVDVKDAEGKNTVSEIKGTIREIEVYPGGTAEWWFVPVAAVETPGSPVTSRTRTARPMPRRAWWAASPSSDASACHQH